jgi:transaldolase/glucose-6-phosphate isomerase
MAQNPLRELIRFGQSVWFDNIRRQELVSGYLQQLIDQDGLSGITSNPSIFEKAIAGSQDYDAAIQALARQGKEAAQIFESLAVDDIQKAADLFLPTYNATDGRDGFVSMEVSPHLAHDTAGSVAEARRLHREVNRPNLMVKIPGTVEGLPAIEQLLGEGININITLLFAVERYEQVANAYLAALEKLVREGRPLNRLASVASFFVSRIDTLADQQLEARQPAARTPEERERIAALLGKVAVSSAKLAYEKFQEIFSGPRFQVLAQKGARVQRVLWASTSTKNPQYSDVLYVENLIGPDTVNTMPASTIKAFREHGKVRASLGEGVDEAHRVVAQLAEAGIDLRSITAKLEEQGVEAFARDYDKLLACVGDKRGQVLGAASKDLAPAAGDLEARTRATLDRLGEQEFPRRLWERDPSLWKAEPAHQRVIRNALGWLNVSHTMREQVETISSFVEEVRRAGFKHAVLLGMGGSSLCPDVCRATFGAVPGFLELHVLDSTVPASVASVERAVYLLHTLFVVSSKSGGTAETLSFYKYFYERLAELKGERAGENFIAITDPGTSLEKLAREKNFRRVFHGQADIGGRYSALSNFGMVPAALMGIDVREFLGLAERMVQACGPSVPARDNPGMTLGTTLAEAARLGRDKVTLVSSPGIASFADWAEQLLAESTGKEGKGLVPVAHEVLGEPGVYGNDRVFVYTKLASQPDGDFERKLQALEKAGHPVIRVDVETTTSLSQEFFRWEVATATAGALMGINPFDQPNVQESKDNTSRLLGQFRAQGKLVEEARVAETEGVGFYCDATTRSRLEKMMPPQAPPTAADYLAAFLAQAGAGDYLALLAYVDASSGHKAVLKAMRMRLRDALRLATTMGYGPRYLHSTGQLHKGGAASGLFIQITADDGEDLPVPGEPYSFSVLKQAQALGDLKSLQSKNRRVVRCHVGKAVQAGLDQLLTHIDAALAKLAQRGARP